MRSAIPRSWVSAVLTAEMCWLLAAAAPSVGWAAEAARAPRFNVRDLRGEEIDLDTLTARGPVLLDFWTTWCKPCLASLPELEAWHQAYGPQGLTVVGVSVDGPRSQAKVRPFAARMRLTYPIVIDRDDRLKQLYQVLAVPTAVLIDTSGAIARVRLGYRPGEGDELERAIRALLGEESSARSEEARTDADPDSSSGEASGP